VNTGAIKGPRDGFFPFIFSEAVALTTPVYGRKLEVEGNCSGEKKDSRTT
jgi:hypothetical protein